MVSLGWRVGPNPPWLEPLQEGKGTKTQRGKAALCQLCSWRWIGSPAPNWWKPRLPETGGCKDKFGSEDLEAAWSCLCHHFWFLGSTAVHFCHFRKLGLQCLTTASREANASTAISGFWLLIIHFGEDTMMVILQIKKQRVRSHARSYTHIHTHTLLHLDLRMPESRVCINLSISIAALVLHMGSLRTAFRTHFP